MIAPYSATGAEQLTLAPGQLILIRKKNPGGWWEGELQVCKHHHHHICSYMFCLELCNLNTLLLTISPCLYLPARHIYNVNVRTRSVLRLVQARGKKRQIGWFPANYVKLLSPSTSKTTPTEPTPPKLAPPGSGAHTGTEQTPYPTQCRGGVRAGVCCYVGGNV